MADIVEKTVAEELRAAARKLRDLAAKAPEGPWSWDGPIWGDGPDGPDTSTLIVTDPKRETVVLLPFAHEPFRHPRAEEAAPWIRMMSPVVAEPLASWLEKTAKDYESEVLLKTSGRDRRLPFCDRCGLWLVKVCADQELCSCWVGALAVARVLNGGDRG